MNDMRKLYNFALECEDLFSDEDYDLEELQYEKSRLDMERFEFMSDGQKEFVRQYGEEAYDNAEALEKVINQIDDYMMLGATIKTRWIAYSKPNQNEQELGNKNNRKWFTLAFHKLETLATNSSPIFCGKLKKLHFYTFMPVYVEGEVDNKEVAQDVTLDIDGNFVLSGYRMNPNGGKPIKIRAAQFKIHKDAVAEIFSELETYYREKHTSVFTIESGEFEVDLYNDKDEQFHYASSVYMDEQLRNLSNMIREKLGIDDLFLFDGNVKFDLINRLTIDYHRTIYENEVQEENNIKFMYHEQFVLDRKDASLIISREIDQRCKMNYSYVLEEEIPHFLDELSEHQVFSKVRPYPKDVFNFPDVTQEYTICINYDSGEERTISGNFDRDGLPDDYEQFAKSVLYMISFYRFSELFDDSYYNKRNPRVDDLIYCSVSVDDSNRTYYYISDDYRVQEGDYVVVPLGKDNEETIGQVVKVEYFTADEVPYPIAQTKHIIRKCNWDDVDGFDFTS